MILFCYHVLMVNDDENYILRILFGKSMFLEHMDTDGTVSQKQNCYGPLSFGMNSSNWIMSTTFPHG